MARVRETKVPFGERLGKAISAVGKGITEAQSAQRESEKFEMMKAQTQQAMQMNEMRMQQVQAQMQQAQELQMAGAKNEILDMALSYSQAKDKKQWKTQNLDSWMQMAPKAGLDVTKFDNVFAPLDIYGEEVAPAYAGIKQGLNVTKTSQWDSMAPAARDAAYQGMISGYDSLIQKTSGEKRKYWIEEKRNADKDWQARVMQAQKASDAKSLAAQRDAAKGTAESAQDTKVDAAMTAVGALRDKYTAARDAIDVKVDMLPEKLAKSLKQAINSGVVPEGLLTNKVVRSAIPEIQELQSQLDPIATQLSRLNDSGNIPDDMIKRYRTQVLPALTVSRAAAEAAFQGLEDMGAAMREKKEAAKIARFAEMARQGGVDLTKFTYKIGDREFQFGEQISYKGKRYVVAKDGKLIPME